MVGSLEDKINVEIAFKTTGSTTAAKEIERLKKELRGIQRDFMGPAASMKAALTDPLKEQIRLLQEQQARVKKFNDEKLREINIAKKGAADYKRMMTDVNLFGDELQWKKRQKAIKDANKEMRRFKGEWMSMMFFGMAIQRVFGGLLRSAYQTFSTATEGTNKANNAMTRLNAAWQFFKFSLIDSLLGNPFFEKMIDWVAGMLDWLAELTNETDGWLTAIIGVAAALGGIMMGAGMIKLGLEGIDQLTTDTYGVKLKVGNILASAGLILISIKEAADAYAAFKDGAVLEGIWNALESAVGAGAAYGIAMGKKGSGMLLVGYLAMQVIESQPFMNAMNSIANWLVALWMTIGDWIGNFWKQDLKNKLIDALQFAIRAIQLVLMANPFTAGLAQGLNKVVTGLESLKSASSFDFSDSLSKNFKAMQEVNKPLSFSELMSGSWYGPGTSGAGTVNSGNTITIYNNNNMSPLMSSAGPSQSYMSEDDYRRAGYSVYVR